MSPNLRARPRLLLVDDSEIVLELVASFLETDGWDVRTADGPGGALASVASFAPHVVVTDLEMPGMKAEDALGLVAALKKRSDCAVFLHSSRPDGELRGIAAGAGADGYVVKSNDVGAVLEAVRPYRPGT